MTCTVVLVCARGGGGGGALPRECCLVSVGCFDSLWVYISYIDAQAPHNHVSTMCL